MVGEGDLVQVGVGVVDVKRRPTAVARLHAEDPFRRALDRLGVARLAAPVHRPRDDRRVVDVGVVVVAELERPAAAAQLRPGQAPVPRLVEQLALAQPVEAAQHVRVGHVPGRLLQREGGEPGVPGRRAAGWQ